MSCCGGDCYCGGSCGCGLCNDLGLSGEVSTETIIVGMAHEKTYFEGSKMGIAAENDGCNCGDNCSCGSDCKCGK